MAQTGIYGTGGKTTTPETFKNGELCAIDELLKRPPPNGGSLFSNMVGRARFERATNWLKANSSTN
jgi:hypothetical protein